MTGTICMVMASTANPDEFLHFYSTVVKWGPLYQASFFEDPAEAERELTGLPAEVQALVKLEWVQLTLVNRR